MGESNSKSALKDDRRVASYGVHENVGEQLMCTGIFKGTRCCHIALVEFDALGSLGQMYDRIMQLTQSRAVRRLSFQSHSGDFT